MPDVLSIARKLFHGLLPPYAEHRATTRRALDRPALLIVCSLTLFSAFTHAAYFLRFSDHYVRDSISYITPAVSAVRGDGFLNAEGQLDTRRTPGYPLLIALFLWGGVDLRRLVLLQHAIAVTLTAGVVAFTLRMTGRRTAAIAAGVVLSLDLPTVNAANSILTETFFAAVVAVVCYGLWVLSVGRRGIGLALAIGAVAGASTLIRPIALYFVVPATLLILLTQSRRRVACAAGFLLAFSLVPLAWAARNHAGAGYLSLSSISGLTMVLRGAGTLAIDDPGAFEDNYLVRRQQLEDAACEDIRRIEHLACDSVSVATRAAYAGRRGRDAILDRPTAYLRVVARGVAAILLGGDAVHLEQLTGRWTRPILFGLGGAACALAFFGCVATWRQHREFCCLAVLTIGYFVLVSAGPEAYSRHRVPIGPIYAVLIGCGAAHLLRRARALW